MEYLDPATNEQLHPLLRRAVRWAWTALALAFLCDAYEEEELEGGDARAVLHLHPALAPYKAAVLPLAKEQAGRQGPRGLRACSSKRFMVEYDETGSIGKRYRRQDEAGTPLCVTVDFDTLGDRQSHRARPRHHETGRRGHRRTGQVHRGKRSLSKACLRKRPPHAWGGLFICISYIALAGYSLLLRRVQPFHVRAAEEEARADVGEAGEEDGHLCSRLPFAPRILRDQALAGAGLDLQARLGQLAPFSNLLRVCHSATSRALLVKNMS